MKVEQLYTGCLAQGAYYIESDGEAAIIDPLREVQGYIDMANERGAKIKYIFETHFHADFVSGHQDLAAKTGATIVYGPTTMETGFDMHVGKDGEIFELGSAKIKLIHTPGHTIESSCYLLTNPEGKEEAIFTGDTLFIGDVGRPDLAQKVIEDLTQDKLARMMYHSLRDKIIPLNDDIIVYPGHGAGSACGKNMSKETSDTLGNQKKTNYALNLDLNEEEFVTELVEGLTAPPSYFPKNVMMNIQGYDSIDEVLSRGLEALSPDKFEEVMNSGDVLVIDTRKAADFVEGFIPGSMFVGIDGSFATWVGTLVKDINQKILIVTDKGREEEVVTRLARVGYDHAIGYLEGGFEAWKASGKGVDKIESITAEEAFERSHNKGEGKILDVRKASEHNSEHVIGSVNAPLDYIETSMEKVNKDDTYFVHCAGGYRSVIFSSILKAKGYDHLVDIKGGFKAIKDSNKYNVSAYVCPTTLL
ncbi:MBL fold metallo-hydrolase [Paracrocinitomix mangrovi]|uniref:MBL fold metallo-hydrolase n=1 Tax=Paracrocinitomix mangrovi TaxID=2862509 RepID=UPI001C8ED015|nr:MBL fold metallo-hydrolase [Paracrocinitomix mangrovi]UKN01070.1 MBL fold metallo-hydrolase [Paracrocinitomix mangrovi]